MLLKVHWHWWYLYVIFHKSLKWKVRGCQIGWSGWPGNVASTTYPSSLECLVEVPRHIPEVVGRAPSCCSKCSSMSRYTWPVMVVSAEKNGRKPVFAYSTENIHLRTVSHMLGNLVRILWSPDDYIWQFAFPDKWEVASSLETVSSKNKLPSSRRVSISVQKCLPSSLRPVIGLQLLH
jgi:hypothetical protein